MNDLIIKREDVKKIQHLLYDENSRSILWKQIKKEVIKKYPDLKP